MILGADEQSLNVSSSDLTATTTMTTGAKSTNNTTMSTPTIDVPSTDVNTERRCTHCGATETPSWRRNNQGSLLCNACGLYERIHRVPRTFVLQDGVVKTRRRSSSDIVQRTCSNCGTLTTPMWRRIEGAYYCNACAIFYRTNGCHRGSRTIPSTSLASFTAFNRPYFD